MIPINQLKIGLAILLLFIGVIAAWLIMWMKPQPLIQVQINEVPVVSVIELKAQTIRLNVHSQGLVTPSNEIDLIPEVAGKIIQLHPKFVTGGYFSKNELLVTIDPRDYEVDIVHAQAQIAKAKRQLSMEEAQAAQAKNEWQALGEGIPSALIMRKPQLAEAQAKLKAAEAGLFQARTRRSRCELRAPFSGRVQSKNIGLGQFVQRGDKLGRIYSTEVAEVRLPLSGKQLGFLDLFLGINKEAAYLAPKVILTAQFAGSMQTWIGRIVRTEGSLDENTGVLYVIAEVNEPYQQNNQGQPLISQLFVQAEIEGKSLKNVISLPHVAMSAAQNVLLVDSEQHLRIRHVEVLRSEQDRILVKNGLNAGDRVVISGIDVPVEGMTVMVDGHLRADN